MVKPPPLAGAARSRNVPDACRFVGLKPGNELVAVPQAPAPVRASDGPVDWFTIGLIWWSYHPSESSYMTTTAVLLHVG